MELTLAHDRKEEVAQLLEEYTAAILQEGPDVRDCLEAQQYHRELQDPGEKFGQPGSRLYLARIDDQPVGCAALVRNDDTFCELKRLYVRPGYRGGKVGQSLIERVIRDARDLGYRSIRLDTFPFMKRAIGLYEHYGFRPVPKYNDNPAPSAVYMQREL